MALRVITPADARRALERMTPRRKPLDNRRVSRLAELMRKGLFFPQGPDEPKEGYRVVAFNDRGELASGRRMRAVIESGRHVAMDVANWGDWPKRTV